jgi:hypothetical protein
MGKTIEHGRTANVVEETLTDNSKVYDVRLGEHSIHCVEKDDAYELFALLEDESKIVGIS